MKKEFIRFIFIGIINTIFYYLMYLIVIYLTNNYIFAVILANVIGILFSFNTFGRFVFNNYKAELIYKFMLIYLINIAYNIVLIKILISYFHINLYIAGAIATILVAINSFIFNKFYVFKEGKEIKHENSSINSLL